MTDDTWRPMAEFDPSRPSLVHDGLNDEVIDWKPELYQRHYERYAHPEFNPGVTEWDGLLLDGWKDPPASAHPADRPPRDAD